MLSGRRVVVTGGAGFIGSHLVEALVHSGNDVVVIDTLMRGNKIPKECLQNIEFHQIDVRNFNQINPLLKGADLVFHFAAILGVDIVADNPVETMENETVGLQSVARAAIENNVQKIIYASTSGVYGHHALERSVTEDVLIDPKTSYAMAKRFNEIYLAALQEEKGIGGIAIRYFNVFGPRQDNRMVIPRFFEQATKNEPLTIYGQGDQTRDFTWIHDVVQATCLVAENVNGFEIFNISNEKEETIKSLGRKVIEITHSKSSINFVDAPTKRYDYEVGRRFGSSDKLYDHVGFKPSTSLENGLLKIWNQMASQ